jgi:hypothetical protein
MQHESVFSTLLWKRNKETALNSERFPYILAKWISSLYEFARTVANDYIVHLRASAKLFFEAFFGSSDECFI